MTINSSELNITLRLVCFINASCFSNVILLAYTGLSGQSGFDIVHTVYQRTLYFPFVAHHLFAINDSIALFPVLLSRPAHGPVHDSPLPLRYA